VVPCLKRDGGFLSGPAQRSPITAGAFNLAAISLCSATGAAKYSRAFKKGNSRKFIYEILHIQVYEGGAKPHSPTPMDRMLPQDVVDLDRYAPRCIEAHRVDLHQRRGLHQFPRIALQAVLTPLLAAL
jgi:hypothetical protein